MTTPKILACPHCQGLGVWVPVAAPVDFYRCYTCSNVWTVPKDINYPEPLNGTELRVKAVGAG